MTGQNVTPVEMLDRLVSFPTVVGTSNQDLMAFVADYLKAHGVVTHVLPGPEGNRSNLFATIGDPSKPGYILSGHVDVVPAGEPEWQADPFIMRQHEDGRLIGRGTCDMKGYVAAILAVVPNLVAMKPETPIHLALSYDEEIGCRGVPHMISALPDLCAPPLGAIIGEPSGLVPVLAHKGKAALHVEAQGISGHSSRTDLGVNAIHAMLPVLVAARNQAKLLEQGPFDPRFSPSCSSLQVGTIAGGQAVNIIPDHAEVQMECRAIAGIDPKALFAPILDVIEAENLAGPAKLAAQWISSYPALALPQDHALAELMTVISGHAPLAAVSYGSEAGLFQAAGIPAIICGPGDISRAHKPEEYLTVSELMATADMILALGNRLSV
ncbi:acetylornithine deacetylase [Thalassospira profundimaris]|uniref:Acetylornithine deacetylase n=1 Tax=Thalassospira profundimaris TaxID=502049 RepID=A0A367XL81_9PROT|nr:acetylornithine deacetylase [Thalassospira profundimaris]RCK53551.1 acetylornithine deacetylase [Thalassospira profundimaris]